MTPFSFDEKGNEGRLLKDDHHDTGTPQYESTLRSRYGEQLLRLMLEAIPIGVAVVDSTGNVVLNNSASERIWSGIIRDGDERYEKSKAWWHDTGKRIEPHEWASIRACTKGETSINEVIEIEAFDGTRKIIQNSAGPIRDEDGMILGAVVVNEDISARKAAEEALAASKAQMQSLATRLLQTRDDERRRIAQMLHEATAQDLAALKMLLARLGRIEGFPQAAHALLDESVSLVDQTMSSARTLSYLLHPPLLDENGLLTAVRWYANGFAARSGIEVGLDLPDAFERLPLDVETTLFRVVQEALINVHRHAQSPIARIRLVREADSLILEIEDHGTGMMGGSVSRVSNGTGADGVGIASMRERLEQLFGRLEIVSSNRGTTVRAIVPLVTDGDGIAPNTDR